MAVVKEKVIDVEHYTDRLFRIRTTRDPSVRFRDGEFLMIGIEVDGKPLMRAYSVASPNYEEYLEFFSIKVPDGPLTSRLQHIQVGDELLVNNKAVGTLVMDNLKPGRNLYLMATGTGVAPFMSITRSLEIYDNFEILKSRKKDKAGNLSGGQRQILALARALVTSPSILLLDEPSAGLSPVAINEVFNSIKAINDAGVSILLVEQNAKRALSFSDRGYVLDQGRNAYQGKGEELLSDPKVVDLYLGKL